MTTQQEHPPKRRRRIPWLGLVIMYSVSAAVLLPVWLMLGWALWSLFFGVAVGLVGGQLMLVAGKLAGWWR